VEFGSSFRGILVSRHVENLMVGRRIRRSATERSGAMGQRTNAFAELSEVGPAFSVDELPLGEKQREILQDLGVEE
jgi:hypothetical protein